jgi:flagellar M-ring protein FliF
MHRLTSPPVAENSGAEGGSDEADEEGANQTETALLAGGGNAYQLPGPEAYQEALDAARQMVTDDPKRVAQVVKNWITEDAG